MPAKSRSIRDFMPSGTLQSVLPGFPPNVHFFVDRPNFDDDAVAESRMLGKHLDSVVNVLEAVQHDAAQLFFGFGKRPVGHQHVACVPAHGLRSLGTLQSNSTDPVTVAPACLIESGALLDHR